MLSAKTNNTLAYTVKPAPANRAGTNFSFAKELNNLFSRKFLNILYWPVFRNNQRYFTSSTVFKQCSHLPGFKDLWVTIQKGSFAYNTLFLGIKPYRRSSSCTDLADITTLALFFGDEFIDGIRTTAGKEIILRFLNNGTEKFYLAKKIKQGRVRLEYSFDLLKIFPGNVLEKINPRYGITYGRFYCLLKYFLQFINRQLTKLPFEKAKQVADKIADACNTCLESYLHDIKASPEQDGDANIETLLQYHELKTRYMQRKLLEVRCTLAGREDAMHNIQSQGWINIMSVVQIYDDMQDVFIDHGFQDNLLLCVARANFPGEWNWSVENKDLFKNKEHTALLTSLYMPCSVQYCLQLASDKIKTMNWEQQKIMHYLLKKNWFIAKGDTGSTPNPKKDLPGIYNFIKNKMQHLPDEAVKSYAVEVCFHDKYARLQLLKKVSPLVSYQLRYNLLSLSHQVKAGVFNDMLKI